MKLAIASLFCLYTLGACALSNANLPEQSPDQLSGIHQYVDGEGIHFDHQEIRLVFDKQMNAKVEYDNGASVQSMTYTSDNAASKKPTHFLLSDGQIIKDFGVETTSVQSVQNEFGKGERLTLTGIAGSIRKDLVVELYEEMPETAIMYAEFTNLGSNDLEIDGVYSSHYTLDRKLTKPDASSHAFKLFQGRGEDWGVPYEALDITGDYDSRNFLGVTQPHRDPKGGGIPLLDVWSPEMGMSIAHISAKPEFVSMPVQTGDDGRVNIWIEENYSDQYTDLTLAPGETYTSIKTITVVHSLDYFDALRSYAEAMGAQGIHMLKETPETVPGSYWKTWGYDVDFTLEDIYSKVDQFKELGIEMIMLDDGWFSNYGDWEPSQEPGKFPDGEAGLIKFVADMHAEGFKVGAWWSPLIAEPHSQLAINHPSWRMQDRDQSDLIMHAPDSYFMCPTHEPVKDHWEQVIEKLYLTWDLDYIYHDWANLIAVPPCYNEAHNHSSPLEPFWNMSDQYQVMYDRIQEIKPGSGVEMCECGRPHDPYKMPFYNITNASDSNSEAQIRQRVKIEKALNGSKTYFGAGYILPEPGEFYDPGTLSLVLGIGAHFQTYYTDLTPDQFEEWKTWLTVYNELELYKAEYLNLYDIAFDVPEVHALRQDGELYYYVPGGFDGELELRGLENKTYAIVDYINNVELGIVEGPIAKLGVDRATDIHFKATELSANSAD